MAIAPYVTGITALMLSSVYGSQLIAARFGFRYQAGEALLAIPGFVGLCAFVQIVLTCDLRHIPANAITNTLHSGGVL